MKRKFFHTAITAHWLFPSVLAFSGFCAMAFEVLWSRALVFFLTSTTYSFTVMLSVVLMGLAGGGWAAAAMAKHRRDPPHGWRYCCSA